MMTRAHRQEALSQAYVRAIAAQAGLLCSKPEPDYGIDLALRSVQVSNKERKDSGVQLDLQLRSTTRALVDDEEVRYDLDTYEYLRRTPLIPRILVLLVQPAEEAGWLTWSPDALILRHCAYWISLRGAEASTASSSVRITIPSTNFFSVEATQSLLTRLANGEMP